MSTNPAFLKGLFGPPDDDPLLSPNPKDDAPPHRRPVEIDATANRSADREDGFATQDNSSTSDNSDPDASADSPAVAPPSLYARIKDVMQKTAGVGTGDSDTGARSRASTTTLGGDGRASGEPPVEPGGPSSMFDFADGDP